MTKREMRELQKVAPSLSDAAKYKKAFVVLTRTEKVICDTYQEARVVEQRMIGEGAKTVWIKETLANLADRVEFTEI